MADRRKLQKLLDEIRTYDSFESARKARELRDNWRDLFQKESKEEGGVKETGKSDD